MSSFRVQGYIRRRDGTPYVNQTVEVRDIDLRRFAVLGRPVTDATGKYDLSFKSSQLTRPTKTAPNLRIHVADGLGRPFAISEVLFNAPQSALLDLVVGADELFGPSEFQSILDAINPILKANDPPLTPGDLKANSDLNDFTFIANQTGIEQSKLEDIATAHQLGKQISMSAEALYGLIQEELPNDAELLLAQPPDAIRKGVLRAAANNTIANKATSDVDSILKSFNDASIRRTTGDPTLPVQLSPMTRVLKTSTLPNLQPLVNTFSQHKGTPQEFWDKLRAMPDVRPHIQSLQTSVQFGTLAMNHAPLVQELQKRMTAGQFTSVGDLASYKKKDWLNIVNIPEIGVPDTVPGSNVEERKLNFATVMENVIEDVFPHRFFSQRLLDVDDDVEFKKLPGKADLQTFLKNNADFDITTSRFAEYVAKKPAALDGLQDKLQLTDLCTAVQRLHSIAPRYSQIRHLVADGVTSSQAIHRMGRSTFLLKYGNSLGGQAEALSIFTKANYAHSAAFNLLANFAAGNSNLLLPVMPPIELILNDKNVDKGIPDWSTLFGSPDTCACDGCHAMDSPAAYFVDILHFLKDRLVIETISRLGGNIIGVKYRTRIDPRTGATVEKSYKDALFERRPDIENIELSCENTKLPLPYIDLSLEILENAIAPPLPLFSKITFAADLIPVLNSAKVDVLKDKFTPPLSRSAGITVLKKDIRWIIDDIAFSYRVERDTSSDLPTRPAYVVTRSLQTSGTAAERSVAPQYMNIGAYDALAKMLWPWDLPYNLYWQTVRVYLSPMEVTRTQLLQVLSPPELAGTLGRLDIARESLGITTHEYSLIARQDPIIAPRPDLWRLYGFPAATLSPTSTIPDPADKLASIKAGQWAAVLTGRVDVFLQRTGIEYIDLLNLLEVQSLFSGNDSANIVSKNPKVQDTCQLNQLEITGWNSDAILQKVHSFLRLSKRLPDWSVIDLGKACRAFRDTASGTVFFNGILIVQLSHVKRVQDMLDIELEQVLTFWSDMEVAILPDHRAEETERPKSFYERTFCNPGILKDRSPIFTKDPATLTGTITDQVVSVSASLGISARHLALMINEKSIISADLLNLQTLSQLYRHSMFAMSLGLEIPDYIILLRVTGFTPFISTAATITHIIRAKKLLQSGFTLAELNWLLRHEFEGTEVNPPDEALAATLDGLRTSLRTLVAQNTLQPNQRDDKGQLVKLKLQQLNWSSEIIGRTMDMMNNTAVFETKLAAFPVSVTEMDQSITAKLTFDPEAKTLGTIGVMSIKDRDLLLATPNLDEPSKSAIRTLYDIPRTFFNRYCRLFVPQEYRVPLPDGLPTSTAIPLSLSSKVVFDPSEKILSSKGPLTETEVNLLLLGVPATSPFVTAVTTLFNLPLKPLPNDEETKKNLFISPDDISRLFEKDTTTNAVQTPPERFIFILQKLLPALRRIFCTQAVVRSLGMDAGLQTQDMEYILRRLSIVNGVTAVETFCSSSFIEANPAISATRVLFPIQYKALLLVKKVSLLITRFKFSFVQLKWLFEFRTTPADPTTGWLDLSSLPLTSPAPTMVESSIRFIAWERLNRLVSLRDRLLNGVTLLNDIFTTSRKPNADIDPILLYLSDQLGFPLTDLTYVCKTILQFTTTKSFQDEVALDRILDAISVLKQLGSSPNDALALTAAEPDISTAQLAVQTAKAKYDQDTWLTSVARPLRNTLREQQRASLVKALLITPQAARLSWRDPSDISAHFLIDVEMGPCQLTSRIKQAICSVQMFVQRCLLNLENINGLVPNEEVDDRWLEWAWMKNQNIHGANYRILISPENYLEAEVRQDQTPLFKDLVSELQQTDVTDASVEKAYRKYLMGLDEVSRLEIVGFYHEEERYGPGPPAVDTMHIIGRTRGQNRKYFYCQRFESSYWSPGWTHIEVEIQSDHLLPIVWNRKLFIFWAVFVSRQEAKPIKMPGADKELPDSPTFWEVKIAWSQREGDRWLAKQVSEVGIITPILEYDGQPVRADQLTLRSKVGISKAAADKNSKVDVLEVQCIAQKERMTTEDPGSGVLGTFVFRGVNSSPEVVNSARDSESGFWPALPPNTNLRNMAFEESVTEDTASTGMDLQVVGHNVHGSWSLPGVSSAKIKVPVLGNTPGTFRVLPAHQDPQFLCQRPFFFQHDQCSHFVVPTIIPRPPRYVPNPDFLDPSWLDARFWARYAEKLRPLIPDINKPYPNPEIAGGLRFTQSGVLPRVLENVAVIRPIRPLQSPIGPVQHRAERLDFRFISGLNLNKLKRPPILFKPGDFAKLKRPTLVGGTPALSDKFRPMPVRTSPADLGSPLLQLGRIIPQLGTISRTAASEIIKKNPIPIFSPFTSPAQFTFSLAYHPFVREFMLHLSRDGIDGLMQRPLQLSHSPSFQQYSPSIAVKTVNGRYADEVVDFDDGLYAVYNWELFYHIPLLIAERLSKNQKFKEAQKWFHYIFDPTDASSLESPQKFWRMRKFFETSKAQYALETLPALFRFMAARGNPEALAKLKPDELTALANFEASVDRWRRNPFQPFAVAQTRTTAFQKSVVMKYLDNLIAWGDQLFRADTMEKINEATQIYTLAAEILGPRPREIPSRATAGPQTFGTLEPRLTSLSNALVPIEDLVRPLGNAVVPSEPGTQVVRPSMLYFCPPRNDKMLSYWDIVSDRLFKIRNCQNLQGVTRQLALFDPPIDPLMLARAAASGLDLSSALNDVSATLPHHRFSVIATKAAELANEVRTLGNTVLSLLEKKDTEALALLRQRHESSLLDAVRLVKKTQIDDAKAVADGAQRSKTTVQARYDHYSSIEFMNDYEKSAMGIESAIGIGLLIESIALLGSGTAFVFPEIKIGTPTTLGATAGGSNFGKAAGSFAAFMHNNAALARQASSMLGTLGTYNRRQDDWDLQKKLAELELKQIDMTIASAAIKVSLAQTELNNHDLQRKNAVEIDEFMRSKFSGQELYDWMTGQISTLYFHTYQTAYDLAKKAEAAYRYDLGLPDSGSPFITFGYWDSLKKGLVAGDKLLHDLKRMELSYLELDQREYEITTTFSLAQLDPFALIQLRELGDAYFSIPEPAFDLLYPGHYFRRIKSVSLTLPCVVGPYTSIACTLTLLKSSIRTTSRLSGGFYARAAENDSRFSDTYGQSQSMATSTGQNDAGLFEVSLRDERYLPFERRGAVSAWRIQLPNGVFRPFDYRTMADVMITIRYTAREGGDAVRAAAQTEMDTKLLKSISMAESQNGLARLFSLRHDFPTGWFRFLGGPLLPAQAPADGGGGGISMRSQMYIDLSTVRFPYVFSQTAITIEKIQVFVLVKENFRTKYTTETIELWLEPAPTTPAPAAPDKIAIPTRPQDRLKLAKSGKLLRTSQKFGKPTGQWILVGSLASPEPQLKPEAIQDVYMVVGYSVKTRET